MCSMVARSTEEGCHGQQEKGCVGAGDGCSSAFCDVIRGMQRYKAQLGQSRAGWSLRHDRTCPTAAPNTQTGACLLEVHSQCELQRSLQVDQNTVLCCTTSPVKSLL